MYPWGWDYYENTFIRHYFLVYHIISHFLLYLQNYEEFEAEILDLQIEKCGLSFDIKKCTTSGWALGDENVISIRSFNAVFMVRFCFGCLVVFEKHENLIVKHKMWMKNVNVFNDGNVVCLLWSCKAMFSKKKQLGKNWPIDHSHIVSIRPGWAHSQRRVGVNITIPLHWPSCEWTLTLPIFLVCVCNQQ